ncbi:MAG TPA: indole-3-glycerol phosphate synthase TrpC [Clostridiales bacterium]|jgi:indole-3-glycerol phosphate synthase|nr:indole-3-glycerol phosphate synthase TrpC [Clostridiales bacterium]
MILDKIAEATVKRVEKAKERQIIEILQEKIYFGASLKRFNNRSPFSFEKALRSCRTENTITEIGRSNMHFICEVKKASPSKGVISHDFPYLDIARDYVLAGASAISVLTEPEFFLGSDRYLNEISKAVDIPVLRKDFILDEYQIYESKIIGADAVLLIGSLLEADKLKRFIKICDELGMSALVEAHTAAEIEKALEAEARIIGVNNRNLQTFEVDLENCIRLRDLVPGDIIYVAESGIRTREDIKLLESAGIDAVLIGEAFMRSENRRELLNALRTGLEA